ncbi:Polygalacturonase inhibitor 1 [Carex littledalei]|uniref:Polygalacturonase inhibitor 1 n=1 Tax=Carex littledalei TaxID=544730 RepID=A0A833QEJ7_9POAL|nr:Polygalacturonase inhibitor 1 [Carex littledalei]
MGQFKPVGFANNTCLCGNPLPPCFNSAPTSAPAHSPASTTLFDSAPEPAPVSTTLFDLAPAHAPVSTSLNLPVSAPFPDSICGFTELEGLEIHNSPGLHGSIPSCLSEFVNLKFLIIKDTSLSGSIPNLSKNTNLETIILNNNHLSGTIPLSFSTLPLWSLDLSSNYLCGEIPNLANSLGKFDATNFANNTCLCGNPLPPCNNLAPTSAPAPAPQVSAPVP